MLFVVFLDPEVFAEAKRAGPYGTQALIAALGGFVQNCCVAEFIDHRIQPQIADRVRELDDTLDRKRIQSLLKLLAKRNRFVYCLQWDYSHDADEVIAMLAQATALHIELALLPMKVPQHEELPELVTLQEYQSSQFESKRQALIATGSTTLSGTVTELDFLASHLGVVARFAARIEICDRLFGRKFGDNYEYTLRVLFRWIQSLRPDPSGLRMVLHCAKPEGYGASHIENTLRDLRNRYLPGMVIELAFYELPTGGDSLPHERFIRSDQIALGIDRGMDFLDRTSRRARDCFIAYKGFEDCDDVLANYSAAKLPGITI